MEPRTAASVKARPEIVLHGLKPEPRGWLAWLTMTDHERIGIMFGPTGTAGNNPRTPSLGVAGSGECDDTTIFREADPPRCPNEGRAQGRSAAGTTTTAQSAS